MTLPAELHVIGLILMMFCVAYFAIFPKLARKTPARLMIIDFAVLGVLFAIAGSVYAGRGIAFSLLVVEVNWWVFTLIMALIIEVPFFLWFCRRWNIDLSGKDDQDER